jgi:hypothetical protein
MSQLTTASTVKVGMPIRRPPHEVFETPPDLRLAAAG